MYYTYLNALYTGRYQHTNDAGMKRIIHSMDNPKVEPAGVADVVGAKHIYPIANKKFSPYSTDLATIENTNGHAIQKFKFLGRNEVGRSNPC